MLTLAEFLLARIAEDEAMWQLAEVAELAFTTRSEGIAAVPPQNFARRMVADCESKRRVVDWCAPVSGSERVPTSRPGVYDRRDVRYVNEDGEDVLRLLALPHADHPDYDESWKP